MSHKGHVSTFGCAEKVDFVFSSSSSSSKPPAKSRTRTRTITVNLLHKVASRGVPWPLGAFDNRRSFAAIGNICAVVERILAGGVPPGTYQVADDEALSTNDVIRLIAASVQRTARIWHLPPGWIRGAARVGDTLHLPLTSERLRKLTESYVVSNAKLKQALGWEKMPVAACDGMRLTLESFR